MSDSLLLIVMLIFRCNFSWCSCIARRPSFSIAVIRSWWLPSFYFTRRSSSCSSPTFIRLLIINGSPRKNSRLNRKKWECSSNMGKKLFCQMLYEIHTHTHTHTRTHTNIRAASSSNAPFYTSDRTWKIAFMLVHVSNRKFNECHKIINALT